MLNFFLGVATGLAAAAVLQNKSRSDRPSTSAGTYGRVDELSSAADNPPADVGMLNAGDGTPSGRSTRKGGGSRSSTGEAGAAAPRGPAQAASQGDRTSDAFNGA